MDDIFGSPEDDVEEDVAPSTPPNDGGEEPASETPVVEAGKSSGLPTVYTPPLPSIGQQEAQPQQQGGTILGIPTPLAIALAIGGVGLLAWYLSGTKKSSLDDVGEDDYDDEEDEDEDDDDSDEEDEEEVDEDEEEDDAEEDDDEEDQEDDREEDFPDDGEDDED